MLFLNERVVKQEVNNPQNTCLSDVSFLSIKRSLTGIQVHTLMYPAATLVLQGCKSPELA